MKALENLRAWKNRIFPDWLWDMLVGGAIALVVLAIVLIHPELFILIIPAGFTVWNQWYNRVFEWRDAALRMAVPVVVYILILLFS